VLVLIYAPEHFNYVVTLDGLPMLLFWIIGLVVSVYSFLRHYSTIPVLGLMSCFYLMAQETPKIWLRFLIWLIIGLVIYFLYSRQNSKLATKHQE
jgi:ABC-type dipeptide/oligopeptide/nickel transport system permease component